MLNSTTYTTRVQKFKMKFFIIITFLISKGKRCHPCTQDIYNRYPKIKHEKYNTLLISIKYRIKFKHEMSISSKHKAVTSDLSACTSIVERSINFFSETLFFFLIGNKNFIDKKSTMIRKFTAKKRIQTDQRESTTLLLRNTLLISIKI